jgi:DNA-binding response OmpR family regulator
VRSARYSAPRGLAVAGATTSSTRSPYLRRKIDDGSALRLIHTIRGVGYELSGARK